MTPPWLNQSPMNFYVVMAMVNSGLTIHDVQQSLANVPWYRVANNVWVVHTNLGSKWIFDRLHPLVNPTGNLFISRLDPRDRQGWMDKKFWDWIAERL